MILQQVLTNLELLESKCDLNTEIKNIEDLNYKLENKKSTLFFVDPDKIEFNLEHAKKLKHVEVFVFASKEDCENFLEKAQLQDKSYIVLKDYNKEKLVILNNFYSVDFSKMKFIAVAGTKGKTLTAYFIQSIMKYAKLKATAFTDNEIVLNDTKLETSLEEISSPVYLYKFLKFLENEKNEICIMELTQEGVKNEIYSQMPFDVLIIPELQKPALKEELFEDGLAYLKALDNVINQAKAIFVAENTPARIYLQEKRKNVVTVGEEFSSTYLLKMVSPINYGTTFAIQKDTTKEEFFVPTLGIMSTICGGLAYALTSSMNIPVETIRKGLKETVVTGRMELIQNDAQMPIYINQDIKDAKIIKGMLELLRKFSNGKIICVVSGDKKLTEEETKELGKVFNDYANYIILTQSFDTPKNTLKNSLGLSNELKGQSTTVKTIIKRERAIDFAVKTTQRRHMLLIFGHERLTNIPTKDEIIEFNQRKIINESLRRKLTSLEGEL